jgi:hypothetical protein
MKYFKIQLFLGLMLILLVFVGCKTNTTNKPTTDVFKGTNGIIMNFMTEAPRSIIYYSGEDAASVLNIILEMKNKGTYGTSGNVYLTGFDQSLISITSAQQSFSNADLEPVSIYNPEGGYKVMNFNANSILFSSGTNEYSPIFQATACYPYQTNAMAQVCVDPKPYDTSKKKPCTPVNVGLSGGQGAPVAVTNVEILPTTNKAMFKVTIQNVGNGDVLTQHGFEYCVTPSYTDYNQININNINLGTISCNWNPTNPIMLNNGKAVVYVECTGIQQNSAYTTNLNIIIDYYYRTIIQKKVQIKNIQ